MQLFYITIFMTTLIAYVLLGMSPATEKFKQDTSIVAEHMAAWHMAATKDCRTVTCSGGTVDPRAYLSPALAAGPAFTTAKFSTQYDPSSKLLVTSVLSTTPTKTGVSFQAIESGLALLTSGRSAMFGVFDRSASRVNLVSHRGDSTLRYQDVPASLASSIPDGSPVIFSSM